jgi:hypothetical protein
MRHHLWTIIVFTWLAAPLFAQTQYDTSPGAQTGVQVFGSYFAADIDSVSNFNGNLHLSIPLFSLPGRELSYGLSLSYNAQKWEGDYVYGNQYGHYTGGWTKANVFGGDFSFFNQHIANEFEDRSICEVYWIDGAGTKHKYVPDPNETVWCGCPGSAGNGMQPVFVSCRNAARFVVTDFQGIGAIVR